MNENTLFMREGETLDEYLWRLGTLKKEKNIEQTWEELSTMLNDAFSVAYDESFWRKRYKKLEKATSVPELPASFDGGIKQEIQNSFIEMEKQRARIRDERTAYNTRLKQDARFEDFLELLKDSITKVKPVEVREFTEKETTNKTLYALLSDVHYGLSFKNSYSEYNSDIARSRVMNYAEQIVQLGKDNNVNCIYVSIMGDMISGIIHQTIRIENRENLISQIFGVSELTAAFLEYLGRNFDQVFVNCVSGNHSRVEASLDNSMRGERLDAIIPWYCKTKLENMKNIVFDDNEFDDTFAIFDIFGKTYVSVHGDMDPDLSVSARRISELIGKRIDYFLAGHLHVPDMRIENVGFIRNGAVVSGGDEYTAKKRLFGPAAQVCMLITPEGVKAIYPIVL